ncbi:hypothetical protein M5689_017718 [Euphorbia peplus]|nr:hypothetical protein M5689_017718 [Euphorbia peplus]
MHSYEEKCWCNEKGSELPTNPISQQKEISHCSRRFTSKVSEVPSSPTSKSNSLSSLDDDMLFCGKVNVRPSLSSSRVIPCNCEYECVLSPPESWFPIPPAFWVTPPPSSPAKKTKSSNGNWCRKKWRGFAKGFFNAFHLAEKPKCHK